MPLEQAALPTPRPTGQLPPGDSQSNLRSGSCSMYRGRILKNLGVGSSTKSAVLLFPSVYQSNFNIRLHMFRGTRQQWPKLPRVLCTRRSSVPHRKEVSEPEPQLASELASFQLHSGQVPIVSPNSSTLPYLSNLVSRRCQLIIDGGTHKHKLF